MTTHRIITAGFGGQGILFLGAILAEAGLREGMQVCWLPSYGPEMRGGTAHCAVILSTAPIASPIVRHPTMLVAMNSPSYERFAPDLSPGGVMVLNRPMVPQEPARDDIQVVEISAMTIAHEVGHPAVANMAALGALLRATNIVSPATVRDALINKVTDRHMLEKNLLALDRGMAEAVSPDQAVKMP